MIFHMYNSAVTKTAEVTNIMNSRVHLDKTRFFCMQLKTLSYITVNMIFIDTYYYNTYLNFVIPVNGKEYF